LAESVCPHPDVPEHGEGGETLYRPREVALSLGINGRTLRLWSKELGELLSPVATRPPPADSAPGERRYAEADLEVRRRVRRLLD
jgi:DNA-binding transcriptional MerR regulator